MSIRAGYMVPHPPIAVHEIGRGEEEAIRDSIAAFRQIAEDIAEIRPQTIILTSPHQTMYRDYFHISPGSSAHGDFRGFYAPEVSFDAVYDTELRDRIESLCMEEGLPAGTEGEQDPCLDHGTMVPLYFINRKYTGYKLIRIGLSGLPLEEHFRFGQLIRQAVEGAETDVVFVASGDLAHCQKVGGPYGFRPEGPAYDKRLMETMAKADFRGLLEFDEAFLEKSMECGHRSFCIMGGALDGDQLKTEVLAHEATFGVGYGFAIYHPIAG